MRLFFILRGNMDYQIILIIFITSYWIPYVDSQIDFKDGLTNLKLFDSHFIEHSVRKRDLPSESTSHPSTLLTSTEESSSEITPHINEFLQTANTTNASNNNSNTFLTDVELISFTTPSTEEITTTNSLKSTLNNPIEVSSTPPEKTSRPESTPTLSPSLEVSSDLTEVPETITTTSYPATTEYRNIDGTTITTVSKQSSGSPTFISVTTEHVNITSSSTSSPSQFTSTSNNLQTTTNKMLNPSTSSTTEVEPSSTNSTDKHPNIETISTNIASTTQRIPNGSTEGTTIDSQTTKSHTTTLETTKATESSISNQTTNSSTSILGSTKLDTAPTSPAIVNTSSLPSITAATTAVSTSPTTVSISSLPSSTAASTSPTTVSSSSSPSSSAATTAASTSPTTVSSSSSPSSSAATTAASTSPTTVSSSSSPSITAATTAASTSPTTVSSSSSPSSSAATTPASTSPTTVSSSSSPSIIAATSESVKTTTSSTKEATHSPVNTVTSVPTTLSTGNTPFKPINPNLSTPTTDVTVKTTTGNNETKTSVSTTSIVTSTKASVQTPIPDTCLATGNEICHKEQKICVSTNGTFECRCPPAYFEKNNTCIFAKYIYEVNFKVNRMFTETLNDPKSEEYAKLYSQVLKTLKEKLEKEGIHITSVTFTNGSIIVHITTATEEKYTSENLQKTVQDKVSNNCEGNLCFDIVPQSVQVNNDFSPCNDSRMEKCPQYSTCVYTSNTRSCDCLPGTTSKEISFIKKCLTECDKKEPCQNNGKCMPTYLNPYYFCKCPATYEGDTCEKEVGKSAEVVSLTTTLYIVIGVGGGFIFLLIIIVMCICCRKRKPNGTSPFNESHQYNAIGLENYKPSGRLRARLSKDMTLDMQEVNDYDEAEPKRSQQTKLTTFERRPSREPYYSGIDNPVLSRSNDKFNGYK